MVEWRAPDAHGAVMPARSRRDVERQTERAHALIVISLTLACTALAIFDLFLLAAGA